MTGTDSPAIPVPKVKKHRVFIVHDHDEGARESVARFVESLGLEPVMLHEQANRGRIVIEKFEAHGDVGFAVVLLAPDDEGGAKGKAASPRARQNALLELGHFLGRLGRDKVCALKKGDLEITQRLRWSHLRGHGKRRLARGAW